MRVIRSTALLLFAALLVISSAWATVRTSAAQMDDIARAVESGDISGAVSQFTQRFRIGEPNSLPALRRFALLVLHRGLGEKDQYERCFAATALGGRGDWAGAAIVDEALASPDLSLRMAAIDGLADAGGPRAIAMLEQVYDAGDVAGRRLVVQALIDLQGPGAARTLTDAASAPDTRLRLLAAEALGRTKERGAIGRLQQVLSDERDPLAAVTVAHALVRLGDASAIPPLTAALRNETPNVRAAAALALGDAADPTTAPGLLAALSDADVDVGMAAAVALTHYHGRQDLPRLKAALADPDAITRQHIGELLERLDAGTGREVVLQALSSQDPRLRMAALRTTGLWGNKREIEAITRVLQSTSDPLVRAEVAWALGRIATRECIKTLMAMVQEADPAVRYTAAEAVARTADRLLENRSRGTTTKAGLPRRGPR